MASCNITATCPAAVKHRFCIGNGFSGSVFNTSNPAFASPPNAKRRGDRQPHHSRSRTATPIPFFHQIRRNSRVNAFNCSSSSAAAAAPPAPVKYWLSGHPSAGFTSSCTAVIKLCHNGFILDPNITTTLISGISRECRGTAETHSSRPVIIIRYNEAPFYICAMREPCRPTTCRN